MKNLAICPSPGDGIVVRYGDVNNWELMVIDAGNLDCGKALVSHVQNAYGHDAVISHALVTHSDADHASGMREVLATLPVNNLWLHKPWEFAAAVRPLLANKSWTDHGLAQELRREYDIIGELVDMAAENSINVCHPFAGMFIGPFRVLSPYQSIYPCLVAQFDRTPDADQALDSDSFKMGDLDAVRALGGGRCYFRRSP